MSLRNAPARSVRRELASILLLAALSTTLVHGDLPAVGADATTVLYRVNAGGPALQGSPPWEADDPSYRSPFVEVTGDNFSSTDVAVAVPQDTSIDASLFQTMRYDTKRGDNLRYRFPVPPGDYEVRLYFAEIYEPRAYVGGRVFDVVVESELRLNDFDVFAEDGFNQGIVKRLGTTATDGDLLVEFRAEEGNPILMGIEVVVAAEGGASPSPSPSPTPVPTASPSEALESAFVYYISPDGSGNLDASSWDNATTMAQLPDIVQAAPPGAEVLIRADAGPYKLSDPVILSTGGAPGEPITIRGVATTGAANEKARIVGNRANPFDLEGETGGEVFRLLTGADHLVFENLEFVNIGNGVVRIGGDINDLVIQDVVGTNVRRFVESNPSDSAETATVSGFVLRQARVDGFSRSVVRLIDDSSGILIEDVIGDSQRQDGDRFAMGVHLEDTVHDAVINRVTMRNAHDSANGPDSYWNADGFVTERDVYGVTFVDTVASGSTDGGYDLKSSDTTLLRTSAFDNKRNYRLWGTNVIVKDCVGQDPYRRGGTGSQAQVHVTGGGNVAMDGCEFSGSDQNTMVYHVENASVLTVVNDQVSLHPDAREELVEKGSTLTRVE